MGRICQNVVSTLFLDMINEAFQSILIIKRKQMLIILYETILVVGNGIRRIKKNQIACLDFLLINGKVTASQVCALKQLTDMPQMIFFDKIYFSPSERYIVLSGHIDTIQAIVGSLI